MKAVLRDDSSRKHFMIKEDVVTFFQNLNWKDSIRNDVGEEYSFVKSSFIEITTKHYKLVISPKDSNFKVELAQKSWIAWMWYDGKFNKEKTRSLLEKFVSKDYVFLKHQLRKDLSINQKSTLIQAILIITILVLILFLPYIISTF